MNFSSTSLAGAQLLRSAVMEDERGYFARVRCAEEFSAHGLPAEWVQSSISHSKAAQTLRGLHYQTPPSREGKLVRCIAGALDDLIVDLRPDSPTFLQHEWFRLSVKNFTALYVPPGFAHGFLTAKADTTILYDMTDFYAPDSYHGIRWSDPVLSIQLPRSIGVINQRDANYPDIDLAVFECFRGQFS